MEPARLFRPETLRRHLSMALPLSEISRRLLPAPQARACDAALSFGDECDACRSFPGRALSETRMGRTEGSFGWASRGHPSIEGRVEDTHRMRGRVVRASWERVEDTHRWMGESGTSMDGESRRRVEDTHRGWASRG